jgi:hypothetical protein
MAYIGKRPQDTFPAGNAVTATTIAANAVGASELAINAVDTTAIADNAITAIKIATNAIVTEQLAQNSVTATQIPNSTIGSDQIAGSAVITAKINADAVTGAKIADDAIDSEHLVDGSIDTAHLADATITTVKITDNAVTLAKMAGIARGKIIIGDSSGDPAALAVGSNGQVLKSDGTDIAWAADEGLSTEEVQDIAGGMFTGNTETGITATYQDGDGTVDLVIGTLNQDTTGLAATATALATARTIGGTSFDGTANIAVGLAGTATALASARTIGGTSFDGTANIVPGTSTALATGRTIGMTGDVVWTSASFDGSGNVTGAATIQANAVESAMIAENNITTRELAANTIATGNIADNAVDGTKIAQNSILTRHIDDGQVTTDQLGADAVTGAKIADDAINSEHYTDGSIDTAHIADDQVTAAKLANTAVTAAAYGSSSAIPVITIDAQGRITAASTATTSSTLTVAADSGSNDTVTVGTDTLTFAGTSNEVNTTVSNNQIQIGLPDNVTIGGNLIVSGDYTVNGDTTTVNTATLSVEDPLIILASGNNAADSVDIGLYGLYDTSGSQDLYAGLFRDASDSGKWKLFKDNQAAPTTTVNTSGTGYATGTLVANLEGNVTGNVTGNTSGTSGSTTGNAATATALATARTIGGVSFDGTANIAVTLAATATALASARTIGGTSFDGTANIVPATVTVADTTDTSSYVALFESATGDLGPKTDAAITYNAGTGALTATSFVGALTGNVTGNASGTAATVTGGTQAAITSAANLVTVGTIGTGVWQGTAIASGYIAADAITGAKIADDAIDSEHYTDGSIDTAHIADDQVTLAKMAGLARGKIIVGDSSGNPVALALGSSGQVLKSDGTDLAFAADSGLSTEEVQDIAGGMFTGNTETGITATYQDGDGTVDLVIGDNSIVAAMIAENVISTRELAANTIATGNIADNAVDGTKIAQNSILTRHIDDGQVTTDQLGADAVTGAKIADDAIDSEHYAAGSIDTAHIADDQITLAKMASGTDGNIISYDASGNPVAIATGTDGQVLTSTGAGSPPAFEDAGGSSNFTRKEFAGDGSTTAFTLDTTPSDENDLMVFIEGVYQNQDAYSLSGTTLTMADAPVSGRGLVVYHVSAAVSGAGMAVNTMTGDGSDTTLTLAAAPGHVNNVQVFLDGVYQKADTYTVSGTTLTFGVAPPSGVLVEARTHSQTAINTFPATGISGLTQVTAVGADHFMIYDATDSALKKALVSDVLDNVVLTDEQAQDIVGAMFTTTNTETGITVTYQDATADIDLELATSQPTITTLANATTVGTIGTGVWQGTAIASGYIAADAITGAKIADDAIDSEHYTDGSIDTAHIANNAILTQHIDDNQVTTDQIAANTIATGNIADNAVDSTKIAQNSILTRHIDDDQVTGDQLADAITVVTSVTTPIHIATTSARITQATLAQNSNTAAAVAWNSATAANAYWAFANSANSTMEAPTNPVEGAIISVEIAQGGTAYTMAWNTVFEFAASTAPTVTATANKTDIFSFRYNGSVWQEIGRVQNMAQT